MIPARVKRRAHKRTRNRRLHGRFLKARNCLAPLNCRVNDTVNMSFSDGAAEPWLNHPLNTNGENDRIVEIRQFLMCNDPSREVVGQTLEKLPLAGSTKIHSHKRYTLGSVSILGGGSTKLPGPDQGRQPRRRWEERLHSQSNKTTATSTRTTATSTAVTDEPLMNTAFGGVPAEGFGGDFYECDFTGRPGSVPASQLASSSFRKSLKTWARSTDS